MKPLQYITAIVLATVVLLASCKPDDDITPNSGSANLQQLGELKPTYVAFQYNGDPVITISSNNYLYEWSSAEKKWSKIDAALPSGFFYNLVQDNDGTYYCVTAGPYNVYTLPKGAASWQPITLPEFTGTDNLAQIVANGVGEVVIRMIKSGKYIYYKKSSASTWSKIKEIPQSEEANSSIQHTPYFMSDNGLVFYTYNGVTDRVFNTNTNTFAKLFDKDTPENIKYAPDGVLLYTSYITPQGTVYLMYQDGISQIYNPKILKINSSSFPAAITTHQELQIPTINHEHSTGWAPLMSNGIVVDNAENIKTMISCNKYPETHWSYASISKGNSAIKVHDHALSQRSIFSNRKGEAFISVYQELLYKWK